MRIVQRCPVSLDIFLNTSNPSFLFIHSFPFSVAVLLLLLLLNFTFVSNRRRENIIYTHTYIHPYTDASMLTFFLVPGRFLLSSQFESKVRYRVNLLFLFFPSIWSEESIRRQTAPRPSERSNGIWFISLKIQEADFVPSDARSRHKFSVCLNEWINKTENGKYLHQIDENIVNLRWTTWIHSTFGTEIRRRWHFSLILISCWTKRRRKNNIAPSVLCHSVAKKRSDSTQSSPRRCYRFTSSKEQQTNFS